MSEAENKNIESKNTSRVEAFSDGVFAIAITLLILEIHVPSVKENETLLTALYHEWPGYLALLIGFFTLLVCWINHHYMFSMIHKCNSVLLLLNGFKLLVVTITPFVTALLSKNIQSQWLNTAVSIYFLNFAFMGLAMTNIWLYSRKMGFIKGDSAKKIKSASRLYVFASLLSTTIWLVSYLTIIGSLALFGLMFAVFVFPEKMVSLQMRGKKIKHMVTDNIVTADGSNT